MIAGAAKRLFHASGGLAAVRFRNRGLLRILMYHRFAAGSSAAFERQCEHLRAHYAVLPMAEIARLLTNGDPFPPHALAITVDDGHADFYHAAYPILRRFELPATLYLTTDFIDGRGWLWFDLADYLFRQTRAPRFEWDSLGPFDLENDRARDAAAGAVKQAAVRMPNSERERLIAELPRALCVDVPDRPPAPWEPLGWDQAREMAAGGMEFGAHTLTHPILSRVEDSARLDREIRAPKERIEQELNRAAIHFCYPNGQPEDYTPAVVERVRQAGFQTATTASIGLNRRGAAPFSLKRVPAEPDREWGVFLRSAAGFRMR